MTVNLSAAGRPTNVKQMAKNSNYQRYDIFKRPLYNTDLLKKTLYEETQVKTHHTKKHKFKVNNLEPTLVLVLEC